jgi:hypothetical protein
MMLQCTTEPSLHGTHERSSQELELCVAVQCLYAVMMHERARTRTVAAAARAGAYCGACW